MNPAVVPALSRDPFAAASFGALGETAFKSRPTVVMGPGVRRDDEIRRNKEFALPAI